LHPEKHRLQVKEVLQLTTFHGESRPRLLSRPLIFSINYYFLLLFRTTLEDVVAKRPISSRQWDSRPGWACCVRTISNCWTARAVPGELGPAASGRLC